MNYPDWWGDGSIDNSKSSYRSKSRSKYDEDEVDDFDRKVTFKIERKKILKQSAPIIKNYNAHPSDQTPYEEDYSSEENEEYEESEEIEEQPQRRTRKPQRRNERPQVGAKIRKGIIYSKLNENPEKIDRDEEPVNIKHSKSGYAMSFSPNMKKKKNKIQNENKNTTNYQVHEIQEFERPHKTYVRRSEQYQKPKPKQHKGRTMKELKDHDRQRALEKRDAFQNTRENQNYNIIQGEVKRKIPKKLKNVESVIKKRIQIDKEIHWKRKMENQATSKDPEIYAPKQKGRENKRRKQSRKQTESKQKSRSNSDHYQQQNNEQQYAKESNHPYYNERLGNERSQRQNTTEGSGYPSVTQATAPQDYYDNTQNSQIQPENRGEEQNYQEFNN